MFRPGEAIALRALDPSGRPLIGLPATIVEDGPDLIAAYLAVGAPVLWPAGPELGGPRGRSIIRWNGTYRESPWQRSELLVLHQPGEGHSVHLLWSPEWVFRGWYVNLEEPWRRTQIGFDIRDLELDIEVAPDFSWHWKDEDEFEWSIAEGRIDGKRRDAIRTEGKRALQRIIRREPPLDRSWEEWRPDPSWHVPSLPDGWGE